MDWRHVDVFYTPHPDDETLSMGVLIAAAVQHGNRVVVVSLTDGRTTGAARDVDERLDARPSTSRHTDSPPLGLTSDQIAAARTDELRRAARDLGVASGDVYLCHLDDPASDDGTVVTVAEAEQVIRTFAARFPGATYTTMSYTAERQQDHLDAGTALVDLFKDLHARDRAPVGDETGTASPVDVVPTWHGRVRFKE